MSTLSPEAQQFLQNFFGPGNEVRWEQITRGLNNSQAADDLAAWIEDLSGFDRPVLLPRKRENGLVQWYALAFSPQQARALREDLMAFVGPTWTCFTGQTALLDPADTVEAAILKLAGQTTYRIDIPFRNHIADVRQNIMRMRSMWKQRPLHGRSAPRPTGRIIRDFELALQTGALDLADRCIDELRSEGRLSAQNLAFLKVRRLAAAGSWEELLALPEVPNLLQVRRPTLVTQALLEAVYAVFLASYEKEGKAREALNVFQTELLPRYSPLFRARGAIRSPDALKGFLLYAASANPPRTELRDAVLLDYPADEDGRDYAEALGALLAEQTPGALTPLELGRKAFLAYDFDSAYVHLLTCPPSRETLQMILMSAYELGTLEAARSVLELMNSTLPGERDAVLSLKSSRSHWDSLKELAGVKDTPGTQTEAIPTGWLEWIQRVAQGPWPAAVEVAERGRLEWDVTALQNNPAQVEQFRKLLDQSASTSTSLDALRYALPHLLAALMPQERPKSAFKPLYLSLLGNLALDTGSGGESFEAMQDLASAILQSDHTPTEYCDVIGYLQNAWENMQSVALLDSALDTLDLLIALPCKDLSARLRFWEAVTSTIQQSIRRVENSQWALFRLLSKDIETGDNAEALYSAFQQQSVKKSVEDVRVVPGAILNLHGKTIALYTLTERAGRRGQELLENIFPGVQVHLSFDFVATDRLRSMARTADYFIVVTRSAKHAATNYIREERPKSLPIIYPAGKGTASILRALFDHLGATLNG